MWSGQRVGSNVAPFYSGSPSFPSRLKLQHEQFVRAINKLVAEKTRDYKVYWGSLQATVSNDSGTYCNASNAGPSLAMLFGSFSGGPFTPGGVDSSDRRKTFVYDGCCPYQCEASNRPKVPYLSIPS